MGGEGGSGARDYEFIPQRAERGHSAEVSVTQQVYWLGLLRHSCGVIRPGLGILSKTQGPCHESEGLTP